MLPFGLRALPIFTIARVEEGGREGFFVPTACKYNLPMHRSARAACLLHPMCFD